MSAVFSKKTIIVVSLIFFLLSIGLIGQPENGKVRVVKYKIITYTNIQGQPVWARVIAEDKDYITISYPENSQMKTETIHRDMIISNSVVNQTVSEFDYWMQIGEYFMTKTWDFENDGQDFIQAKRSFQKARDVVVQLRGNEHALTKELNKKIEDIEIESEKWLEMVREKADFDKLEFQSKLQKQLVKINSSITDNSLAIERLMDSMEKAEKNSAKISDFKNEIRKSFDTVSDDLKSISQDVENNAIKIDRLWRRYEDPYYYTPGRRTIIR